MKIKNFISTTLLLTGVMVLSSCNSDSTDSGDNYFVDIVTLESTGSSGSVMSLQQMEDSPVITLLSTQRFESEDIEAGKRIVIYYHPESNKQYVSDNINIGSASTTFGGGDPYRLSTALATNNWESNTIKIASIWRTGKYLNFVFTASTSSDAISCDLFLDEATVGSNYPNFHIVFKAPTGAMPTSYTYYASFDISETWQKDIDGIRINYSGTDMFGNEFTNIIKTQSSLRPVE